MIYFSHFTFRYGISDVEEHDAYCKPQPRPRSPLLVCRHGCRPSDARSACNSSSSDLYAASACERNWSVYGQIRTAQKARMQHQTADKLVYCHDSMHLQQKLQDSGWAPDVERWDSDEDSDGSDHDDDHADRLELAAEQVLRLCM